MSGPHNLTLLHAKMACREKMYLFAFGHTDIDIYTRGTEHSTEAGDYLRNNYCVGNEYFLSQCNVKFCEANKSNAELTS
jgi:hypothetical protein